MSRKIGQDACPWSQELCGKYVSLALLLDISAGCVCMED
jgi:hypothetical protein